MISQIVVAIVLWAGADQELNAPVAQTTAGTPPEARQNELGPPPSPAASGEGMPLGGQSADPPAPLSPVAAGSPPPATSVLSPDRPAEPIADQAQPMEAISGSSPPIESKSDSVRLSATPRPTSFTERPATGWSTWMSMAGWLLSGLLVCYLLLSQRQWRIAFQDKEWLLMPSQTADQMREGVQSLSRHAKALDARVDRSFGDHTQQLVGIAQAIHDTRSEFAILRDELDRKTKEIADLKIGHDFQSRKSILRAVAYAMQIIEEDQCGGRDAAETLKGVVVELQECLQDNNVMAVRPDPGARLTETKGVSIQESIREQAPEPHLKGTIRDTLRPAYVIVGPSGSEEIVRQARVRIYT